jgi:hypothetical protein
VIALVEDPQAEEPINNKWNPLHKRVEHYSATILKLDELLYFG